MHGVLGEQLHITACPLGASSADVTAASCVSDTFCMCRAVESMQLGEAAWQADCVLLLWLSQLLLIPFDLATVDSSMAELSPRLQVPSACCSTSSWHPPVLERTVEYS